MELPLISEIQAAIAKLSERLQVVEAETHSIQDVAGRILAADLLADRDSPATNVSAMDGYAIRLQDINSGPVPVVGTCAAGAAPRSLPTGAAIRIFTGAPVPFAADCVIRREDTEEQADSVRFNVAASQVLPGQNIRLQGENSRHGSRIIATGTLLDSVAMAAVASFGTREIRVHRRVRVSVLNTGDELVAAGEAVEPWQIRDSNGPTLDAWLRSIPWVEVVERKRVADDLGSLQHAIGDCCAQSDAIILTGGVSMGDADFVPAAFEALGGEILFHRLPIRPGKPILGGCLHGKLLLGLPGNPVSVAVTARVFGEPLLLRLAGCTPAVIQPLVHLANPDAQQLPLTWYRLVTVDGGGCVQLVRSQGSGDLVSLAHSHGFIAVPPGQSGPGPYRLTLWNS
ncbi:MAG: molybdopterin molybdotransferase MoeA [Pirellulaceae bacterium]